MPARPRRRPMPRPGRTRTAATLGSLVVAALLAGCGTPPPSTGPAGPTGAASASSGTPSTATSASPSGSATSAASPSASRSASASASATSGGSCQALAGRLSRPEQVGQLFMVAANSVRVTQADLDRLAGLHIGSVLLLGNTDGGAAAVQKHIGVVKDGVGSVDGIEPMLAVDQEGGLVQRLSGPGFSTIPSATVQGTWSSSTLESRAAGWGRQLRAVGVDVDLAPVADVVPASLTSVNQPIGVLKREYGTTPGAVAPKVAAFVQGMRSARIGTSVKHFPGLGQVRGNTDFDTNVVDSVTTRHDADLAGFAAGVKAGADMVMISSATYARIDADRPAAFSPTVIQGMVRGDLGFDGVVISDDLAGKALGGSYGSRATRFFAAGGDLAIMGQPASASAMTQATLAKANSDRQFAATVEAAAARVLALKARYGLADCS
ncbi:beta-N-acetylhexosaminidase [Friedmanniella endophytica]|uniref:Beta-N-acetylhexosaminidase n=1 Tax=Microlunatus kandeliicorticis TaxID=1759536 RepID=A0A7W3P7Q7_9ACTN|nr:glycoside hydrolase family 3 N-terminal domain-containing protein [Microlunatus kandeliicorticis]MBA8796197.1 beta-N-acetylhexosaminidase [Microlunatus kandeliicorticis]